MRPRAARLLAVLLLLAFLATAMPEAASPFPVRANAASVTIDVAADRVFAGRGDPVTFTVWANVTGAGQFQSGIVNLSFERYLGFYAVALLPSPSANATWPGSCIRLGPAEWECFNMRAGYALVWTVPYVVNASYPRVGFPQNATATLWASQGGTGLTLSAATSVWIAGATLEIRFGSSPLLAAAPGDLVTYNVTVVNVLKGVGGGSPDSEAANATAFGVNLSVRLDPAVQLASPLASLNASAERLTPASELQLQIPVIVRASTPIGTVVSLDALVTYRDFNNRTVLAVSNGSSPLYVRTGSLVSTSNLIVGAAVGLAAVVVTIVVLLYMGQRKVTIDEAFLMYRNGVLISHASLVTALKKDDDLVASMLLAIQEFVRDSFRSEALLDEVAFGGRRAALVRGQRVILVAVISRGDADSVVPQMLAAVHAVEDAYGSALATWNGRMSALAGVDDILQRFLRGGFRSAWRAQIT